MRHLQKRPDKTSYTRQVLKVYLFSLSISDLLYVLSNVRLGLRLNLRLVLAEMTIALYIKLRFVMNKVIVGKLLPNSK